MSTSFTNVPSLGQAVLALSTDSSLFDKGLSDAEEKAIRLGSRLELAIAGAGVAAFGLATKAAIDFESAFTDVRKTVDASEAEFGVLSAGLRGMAKDIPVAATELARLTGLAGQLGIENESLLGFTRTMADLSVATNLTGDAAALALARFANITNMDQSKFSNLGSAIVDLGNNFATTEADIAQFALRTAGAGEIAGFTEADILGLGTAMSAVGVDAEAGGTAIQKVILKISEAVVEGSDKLDLFAEVAGMSGADFAKAWKEDAGQAFVAFVEGLGKQGQNAITTLSDLDLHDQRLIRSFLSLSGAGDLLSRTMELSNKAFEDNVALAEEAERRYGTTASQLTILKNNLIDIGITFGESVTPAIGAGSEALSGLLGWFGQLPDSTQQLLLLGATVLAIGPKFVSLASSAIASLKLIEGQAATTQAKMLGIQAAILLAVVAVDALLARFTGAGLFERVFGDVAQAEAATAALKDWNAEVLAAGPNADRLVLINQEFKELVSETNGNLEEQSHRLNDITTGVAGMIPVVGVPAALGANFLTANDRILGFNVGLSEGTDRLKGYEERTRVLAEQMKLANVHVVTMKSMYDQLPEPLQKTFDEVTGLTEAWQKYQTSIEQGPDAIERIYLGQQSMATAFEETIVPAHNLITELGGWGPVLDIVGEKAGVNFSSFRGEIPPTISSAEGLSKFLKTEFSPEVAEVFDTVLASAIETFDGLTEAYEGIIPTVDETFVKWKQRMEKMAKDHEGFEASLTTIWNNIKTSTVAVPEAMLLTVARQGPEYAANFAKWFAEDPEAALKSLETGAKIATGKTVDNIVNEITGGMPEVSTAVNSILVKPWEANRAAAEQEAIEAAAAMHDALISGVLNPTELARVHNAGSSVGSQLGYGVAAGIATAQASGAVAQAAKSLVQDAINKMKETAQTQSPSKVTRDEVGLMMGTGLAEGLYASQILVSHAAEAVINTALNTIKTGWTKVGSELGGGTVPDWVIKNSPYLSSQVTSTGLWSTTNPGQSGAVPTGAYGQPMVWDPAAQAWVLPHDVGQFIAGKPLEFFGGFDKHQYDIEKLYESGAAPRYNSPDRQVELTMNVYGPVYGSGDATLKDVGWGLSQELGARGVL